MREAKRNKSKLFSESEPAVKPAYFDDKMMLVQFSLEMPVEDWEWACRASMEFGTSPNEIIRAAVNAARRMHENPQLLAEIKEFNAHCRDIDEEEDE